MITKEKFEDFKNNNFSMLPMVREVVSPDDNPLSLFEKISDKKNNFLLESVEGGDKWAQYSIIGFGSLDTIKAYGNVIETSLNGMNERFVSDNPLKDIEKLTSKDQSPNLEDLPRFYGGYVGFFAYESAQYAEKKISCLPQKNSKFSDHMPDVLLVKADQLIIFDNLTKSIRPRINENRKDKKLTNFSEFFESGDLVWLSKDSNQNKSITLSIHPKVQSALVSLNPSSGEILALVGGYNFRNSQFNRAIQAKPQLGSNFKPFLYAAAFENGFNPASIIVDSPLVFDDQNLEEIWRPRNASGKFYGPTRLREALVQSRNVVSVKLLQEVSIKDAKESLEKFGFYKEELPNDLSLALGSYGASPLKNAELFSIFANGGKKVVPYFIDRILFPDGNEINFSEEKKSKTGDYLSQWFGTDEREADNFSIDPRIAFMINDILKEAAQRGTGRKINELGRKDFAAKTGTSNDAESTWFTGFNENILTTVWFGYDNPSSLGNNEFGSTTSLPIWLNYKKQIIDTIPKGKFKKPSGLIARKINLETGELAKPEDERVKFELFLN